MKRERDAGMEKEGEKEREGEREKDVGRGRDVGIEREKVKGRSPSLLAQTKGDVPVRRVPESGPLRLYTNASA